MLLLSLKNRLARFLRHEAGSYTAEAVIWTPVFALLLGLLADTSIIFGDEALALRQVQDVNRSLAVGHFLTVADAQTYLQGQLAQFSPNATVNISISNSIITTIVTLPTRDLTATGLVSAFAHATVTIKATQMSES